MIYAVISDIHGNLEALTAVLKDIGVCKTESILFIGDAVGYGANPNEVVELVDRECAVKLLGNHDCSTLGMLEIADFNPFAQLAIAFTTAVMSDEAKQSLSSFELEHRVNGMRLVHATPDRPSAWNYCLTVTEARRQFECFREQVCLIGHSHKPTIFQRSSSGDVTVLPPDELRLEPHSRYIVNVGSVGQPRDGDSRACYVLYDSDQHALRYRRVAYDVETAQRKMAEANLPSFLIDRLTSGR